MTFWKPIDLLVVAWYIIGIALYLRTYSYQFTNPLPIKSIMPVGKRSEWGETRFSDRVRVL